MRAVIDVISALEKTTVTKELLEVMTRQIMDNFIMYMYNYYSKKLIFLLFYIYSYFIYITYILSLCNIVNRCKSINANKYIITETAIKIKNAIILILFYFSLVG